MLRIRFIPAIYFQETDIHRDIQSEPHRKNSAGGVHLFSYSCSVSSVFFIRGSGLKSRIVRFSAMPQYMTVLLV